MAKRVCLCKTFINLTEDWVRHRQLLLIGDARQEKSYLHEAVPALNVEIWRKLSLWLILCNEVVPLGLFCLLRKLDIFMMIVSNKFIFLKNESMPACVNLCVRSVLWPVAVEPSAGRNLYYREQILLHYYRLQTGPLSASVKLDEKRRVGLTLTPCYSWVSSPYSPPATCRVISQDRWTSPQCKLIYFVQISTLSNPLIHTTSVIRMIIIKYKQILVKR